MAAPAPRDAKRVCPAALEARVSTTELPGPGRPGRVYSVLAGKFEERFLAADGWRQTSSSRKQQDSFLLHGVSRR